MYYKENVSLRIISTSYFDQCLLCEVTCQNQKGHIAVIYHSPRQSHNLFNLQKLINQSKQLKPSFTIILSDFFFFFYNNVAHKVQTIPTY